jgi:hypothetical protein
MTYVLTANLEVYESPRPFTGMISETLETTEEGVEERAKDECGDITEHKV